MTTTQTVRSTGTSLTGIAAVTTLATFALDAFGVWGYGDVDSDAGFQMLVIAGFTAVTAAVVFGLVLPRALGSDHPGRTGLVLSVLALLIGVPLFWAGVAPVLAVGGIVAGRAAAPGARDQRLGTAAFVVGILALIACLGTYAGDWLSHAI